MTNARQQQIRKEILKINENIKSCGNALKRLLAELDEEDSAPRQTRVSRRMDELRIKSVLTKKTN